MNSSAPAWPNSSRQPQAPGGLFSHRPDPSAVATKSARSAARRTGSCDFAMNFGMFWMSTGLLVPILPFFTVFAF